MIMRFKDYLISENSTFLKFKSEGILKFGKFLEMYSKSGKKLHVYGDSVGGGGGTVIMNIVVYGDVYDDGCIAKISYKPAEDPNPTVYYTHINTDDYDEMKQTLDEMFD